MIHDLNEANEIKANIIQNMNKLSVYNIKPKIERGRQYHLQKRYEFQNDNFSSRSSSQYGYSVHDFDSSIEEAKAPRYSMLPNELNRVKSQGYNTPNKNNLSNKNLVQFKRNSIANINFRAHAVNTYDDNTVFETKIHNRRSLNFDQQQKQIDGFNQNIRMRSFEFLNNVDNETRKSYRIYQNTVNPVCHDKLFKKSYLQAGRVNSDEENSSMRRSLSSNNSKTLKSPNRRRSKLSAVSFDSSTDASVLQNENENENENQTNKAIDILDLSSIDSEEANQGDIGKIKVVGIESCEGNGNKEEEEAEEDDEDGEEEEINHENIYIPMRTQQRKIAIKEEMFKIVEDEPIGSSWMDIDNYKTGQPQNGRQLGKSMQYISRQEYENSQLQKTIKATKPQSWMYSSFSRRNTYERVTNNLRNLVLFSHHPLLSSVERIHTGNAANMPARDPHITLRGHQIAEQIWTQNAEAANFQVV